jgi:hypothetical protein
MSAMLMVALIVLLAVSLGSSSLLPLALEVGPRFCLLGEGMKLLFV